jgi:hypothetical protein
MTGSVTFSTAIGGDGSTVTDDDNATTGLRDGGWRTRFVPCFTNQVSIANYVVTKANEAAASQTAAGSSATAAAAAYDSFDDRYLGAKSSNPTVDNDGNALLIGALYWNTVSNEMRVYSGSAWIAAYIPSSGYLALTGGTMTGAITFAAGQFGTNVNTFLSTPSSANLAAALTDETGTGVNVFNNTPTLIAPILGTPTSGTLTNCTFPTLNQNTTGTAANLTSATTLPSGMTLVAPILGTPASGNLTNCTGYTYANLSGTVPTWNQNTTGTAANLTAATTLPSGMTLVAPLLGTPSSGTLSSCTVDGTNGVGYINIPQNSQSAAYTLVAADAGKHIFHPSTDANARTFTIPANSSVAYPIGTAISFVNMTSQVVSIAITTDTMYLAGTGTTGTRSLAQYGTATALKMTSTTWIISGAGLT